MELDRIKILVDRYFEAEITLDEEQELREYFTSAENIPEEYAAVKLMLGVISSEREVVAPVAKHKPTRHSLRRWHIAGGITIAAAAAAIIIMLITPYASFERRSAPSTAPTKSIMQHDLICYVDGVKLTDMNAAHSKANSILGGVASDIELAMVQVNRFNIQSIK